MIAHTKEPLGGTNPGDSPQQLTSDLPPRKPHESPAVNISADAVQQAAIEYRNRGWAPTPIKLDTKQPSEPGWERTRFSEEEINERFPLADLERNVVPPNIGLVLGQMSGGLVVVDLDHIDLGIARLALPKTGLIDGRPGNPDSHWFYRITGKLSKVECVSPKRRHKIVELLADGQQVVVPPSRHPSGEARGWSTNGEPTPLEAEELIRAIRRAGAYQELRNIWPEPGARHNVALALAGGLLRTGIDEAEVERLLTLLWESADRGQVSGVIQSTVEKLGAEGRLVTGWPTLLKLFGDSDKASVAKIAEWLGVDDFDVDDPRPKLSAANGDLHEVTVAAWEAMESRNDPPLLFVRSGEPVRIEPDEDGRPVLRELTLDRMRFHLSKEIRWVKPAGKDKPAVSSRVPIDIIRNMLATPQPPLPPIKSVVSAPILSPNGEINIEPGYHAASRVFYQPLPGVTVPAVANAPSRSDIEQAKTLLLDEMLGDFPFESQPERANALAMLLLPFGREVIDGHTPFHFVEAPRPGTGKSKLAHLATMLVCGPAGAASISETTDDEEWRKRITSALMLGSPFIFIDNITQTLNSSQLAKVVTEGEWSDRRLGSNDMVTVPVRCTWIITANNAAVNVDIARRSIRIRLNAKVEDPFSRDVRGYRHPNLEQWVIANRGRLIWACLTLWRAWVAAGKPDGGAVLGSFEQWAATMSGVLQVAGVEGFLTNTGNFLELADSGTSQWRELTETWWERFGNDSVRPKELYNEIAFKLEGFDYAKANSSDGRVTAFGIDLKKQRGTIHGDLEIIVETMRTKPVYRLHHVGGETRKARPIGLAMPSSIARTA